MSEAGDLADFGRFLEAQRVLRGLSVDEVARATKISPALLRALEGGERERLPERVFMLNYVRSYAKAVGLEPDAAVARYELLPDVSQPQPFDPRALEVDRRARAVSTLVAAVAAVLLLAAALGAHALFEVALRYASR